MNARVFTIFLGVAGLLLGGCAMPARQPRNLDLVKRDVAAYVDSGEYLMQIAAVTDDARAFIEKRAARRKPGERLAVVFDIDETALSNVAHMRSLGWGYIPGDWDEWVARGEAPAIAPVLLLFRAAQHASVDTIFITGRREQRDGPGTVKNLSMAGYTGYTRLVFMPEGIHQPTGPFKAEVRRRLVEQGFTIIANIGDQQSDLSGGYAEKTFKLPGPFYITE